MRLMKILVLAASVALTTWFSASSMAQYHGRQYYSSWYYYPTYGYYYRHYYYKPYASYDSYRYHYCIYYPSYTPSYVYYYNPYSSTYWGRFDTKGTADKQYSTLVDKDRKANLKDIPESTFPEPGPMPAVPESKDGEKMTALPNDLPKAGSESPKGSSTP